MSSICPEINIVINMAMGAGNEINENTDGWSKAKRECKCDKPVGESSWEE